jgi:hypothetical protein
MSKSYFRLRPDKVITVLLFDDDQTYRAWARKLFGDEGVSVFGYYRHAERTLVMNIHTGTGTLVHELTHALIDFDWPGVPLWFNEGLASLHEQCQVGQNRIVGLPNWRLPALQQAVREGTLRSLSDLVGQTADFYGAQRGLNYAQARYFCEYLQDADKLEEFYRRLHDSAGKDAVKVIEGVCGEPIGRVDEHFKQYALKLKFSGSRPQRRLPSGVIRVRPRFRPFPALRRWGGLP